MSFDQLDFVTYCIGNLSIRLQLPQKAIYARLKSTGILDDRFDGSIDKAMEVFYNSATAQMIQDGVPDLHCRSDHYLADEIYREYNISYSIRIRFATSLAFSPTR